MKPVRVLLAAPSFEIVGGQSVQAARLLDALRSAPDLAIDFQPINPRLPHPLRALQRMKYVRTAVTETAYVASLLRRSSNYDILHVFTAGYSSYWLTYGPAPLIGYPRLILHYHDGRAEDHFGHAPKALRWAARAGRIVVPSRFLVDIFGRFGLSADAIPNIVDESQFRYRRRDVVRPRFLHNRGLESHYNVPCTIRAFAAVQNRYPDASLVIAHNGPLRSQVESMVSQMGLRHVTFLGAVTAERMRELYDEADVYLMSPNIDNMPLSVLECYASGLPLVSTAAGGVPGMVHNERTGLLVPVGDDRSLASAALRLIEEPGLAMRLAENGRRECQRYGAAQVASQWMQLYRELLGRQPSESESDRR